MTQVMTHGKTEGSLNLDAEHDALQVMPIEALRRRYLEVGGHATRTRNREYLVRRILWLRQAAELGGLSERALGLARELAAGGQVRATPPVAAVAPPAPGPRPARDGRLPCPGTRSSAGTRARRSGSPCWPTASSSAATATGRCRPSRRR